MILDDDLIASVWCTDNSIIPYGRENIRYPLTHLRHAFGNCDACPTKSLLGYNLGQSRLGSTLEDRMSGIEIPDTDDYADEDANDACEECQNFMSTWLAEKVKDNPDYLWALGGSGLIHEIPENLSLLETSKITIY